MTVFAPPFSFFFKLICALGGKLTADGVRRFRNGRPIALIKLDLFRSASLNALALALVEFGEHICCGDCAHEERSCGDAAPCGGMILTSQELIDVGRVENESIDGKLPE